jgi:ATP-dependent Clp protease adapter protein ClpS
VHNTTTETPERTFPRFFALDVTGYNGPSIVILYNDDHHSVDEVVSQIQKATGYPLEKCIEIMLEAHTTGRAIAYEGTESDCERVATVLRQIRLQVETDTL